MFHPSYQKTKKEKRKNLHDFIDLSTKGCFSMILMRREMRGGGGGKLVRDLNFYVNKLENVFLSVPWMYFRLPRKMNKQKKLQSAHLYFILRSWENLWSLNSVAVHNLLQKKKKNCQAYSYLVPLYLWPQLDVVGSTDKFLSAAHASRSTSTKLNLLFFSYQAELDPGTGGGACLPPLPLPLH